MSRLRQRIGPPVVVRPWARRVRVRLGNPEGHTNAEIQDRLPEVLFRMNRYGHPVTVADLGRKSLTALQSELRAATQASDFVALDPLLQEFRKDLHLLLDH